MVLEFLLKTVIVYMSLILSALVLQRVVIENLWLEITRFGNIVIYGGIYRHPNHNIPDFASKFEDELNKISSRRIPCVVAGDFNIDLLKFDNHTATH